MEQKLKELLEGLLQQAGCTPALKQEIEASLQENQQQVLELEREIEATREEVALIQASIDKLEKDEAKIRAIEEQIKKKRTLELVQTFWGSIEHTPKS